MIAEVLGLPCTGDALPAKTACPFCKGKRLSIYKDSRTGGQWHYCFDCHRCGDSIDLASGVWGLSHAATTRRLTQAGVPVPTALLNGEEYDFSAAKKRQQILAFWQLARQQLPKLTQQSVNTRQLRERLCLGARSTGTRFDAGPGQLFGAVTARQIIDHLFPGHKNFRADGADYGYHKLLGAGWLDAIVLPYFVAPQNIHGFEFIGRDGNPGDFVYTPMYRRNSRVEAGLYGLDALERAGNLFGTDAFAVDNAAMALRLQVRHFAESNKPLPLLAYYDGGKARTREAWYAVERKRIIFWCWRLTASVLYQAMQCDGYISIAPLHDTEKETIDHYFRSATPADLLRRAAKRALPWREALTNWAVTGGETAVEELMLTLADYEVDLEPLAAMLNYSKHLGQPGMRTAVVGKHTIVERPSGWYQIRVGANEDRYQERLLSEVIVRIDHVSSDPLVYFGRLIWGDRTAPFRFSGDELRERGANAITRACIRAGLGVPRIYSRPVPLEQVAVAFQRPQVLSEAAAVEKLGLRVAPRRKPPERKPEAQPGKLPESARLT